MTQNTSLTLANAARHHAAARAIPPARDRSPSNPPRSARFVGIRGYARPVSMAIVSHAECTALNRSDAV